MLLAMSGEPKSQESNHTIMCHHKCRIPQRLPPGRQRSFTKPNPNEQLKNNGDVLPIQPSDYSKSSLTRPCSGESRPKSANRTRDLKKLNETTQIHAVSRPVRPERERLLPAQRNPVSPVHKKKMYKLHSVSAKKADRHIITVPVKQNLTKKNIQLNAMNLPDQETINKCEDLELKQGSDADQLSNGMKDYFLDLNEEESVTSKANEIINLKSIWQEKIIQFEGMKNELNDRQIMNVANMTPNQLLKLCETTHQTDNEVNKNILSIDMKKLNAMPSKLVAMCERTLSTRRDFIGWFENLKNQEKGCSKSVLSKKINEFNAENEMLSSCLKTVESEFLNEINGFIRICCNEIITLQLRNEDLLCELSELNSQNADLRKKVGNFENQKTYANKIRIEALEQELKEEKMKRMSLKDKLSRTEGQIKIGEERATLLESALNQARAQTRSLERTIQQLNDQNKELRKEFDQELNKVKESMQKNTVQLEEIVRTKETLQLEKEDLKNKLKELSNNYNESMMNMKQELNKNIAKLIDVEKKYNEEIENKKHLQARIESQCAHLVEYELRCKDILKQLQEKESTFNEVIVYKDKYEQIKQELGEKSLEIDKCVDQNLKQTEALENIERKLYNSVQSNEALNNDMKNKENYIKELEMKQVLFSQQIKESEQKMEAYEEQLLTLKSHITKLKDYFGDFENLNNLHELVNQQKNELSDTKHKYDDVVKEIDDKKIILKKIKETILEYEEVFKQKQDELKDLSDKQKQYQDLLQRNQIILEKDLEIEALINDIETRKVQIDQLETIIRNLENQNHEAAVQKRRYQDKICALEKKIIEYKFCIERKSKNLPSDDLDNLIKILEDELETQTELQNTIATHYNCSKRNEPLVNIDFKEKQSFNLLKTEKIPTKIIMGNFVQKTYLTNNEGFGKVEPLGRKKAITSIKTQKNEIANESRNIYSDESKLKTNNIPSEISQFRIPKEKVKNMNYIKPNLVRSEKINKMLKLASHRLP